MKKLTKQFRIMHVGNEIINENIEYPKGSVSYPASKVIAVEFDTLEEAEVYIIENNLVYERFTDED